MFKSESMVKNVDDVIDEVNAEIKGEIRIRPVSDECIQTLSGIMLDSRSSTDLHNKACAALADAFDHPISEWAFVTMAVAMNAAQKIEKNPKMARAMTGFLETMKKKNSELYALATDDTPFPPAAKKAFVPGNGQSVKITIVEPQMR
jgi:hypothetical protein